MKKKNFSSYELYGAYHWYWFNTRFSYTRHVGYLKNMVKEKNTLQVGAGDGLIAHELEIKGIDNNRYAVDLAEIKGVKIDLGDATRLPYKKEQFDSVLMADLLEYVKNTDKALSEAKRVLKKYLYITLPIAESYIEGPHEHYWKPEQLVDMVEKKGFKLVSNPASSLSRLKIYFKFAKV